MQEIKFNKAKAYTLFIFIMLLIGSFIYFYSFNYPAKNPLGARGIGPRFFPQLAAMIMGISCLLLLIMRVIFKRFAKNEDTTANIIFDVPGLGRIAGFIIVMIVYATILLPIFKFIPATLIASMTLLFISRVKFKMIIFNSIIITLFYWGLFIKVLKIPFP